MCLTLHSGKHNRYRLSPRGAYGLMEGCAVKRLTGCQGRHTGVISTAGIVMSGQQNSLE